MRVGAYLLYGQCPSDFYVIRFSDFKIQNEAGVKAWLGTVCLASLRTKVQSPEAIFKKAKARYG